MAHLSGTGTQHDRTAVTLTALRYLVALADTGHFGRAAAACHVSQPTLSEQIRKLETVLGTPLIERGRTTRLTAAGSAAVGHARSILRGIDDLMDSTDRAGEPLTGAFRLGLIPTLAPYLLPTMLPALRAAYPRLRLSLGEGLTTALLADLAEHRLDAALVALPIAAPGLRSRPVFDEPFLALLPAGHPLSTRPAVALDDLRKERVLLLAEGHCLREQALELCGPREQAVDGADLRATSIETLVRLVAAGLGVTLVPALAAPHNPNVISRPLTPARARIGRSIGLAWRKSYARPENMLALAAVLRQTPPPAIPAR